MGLNYPLLSVASVRILYLTFESVQGDRILTDFN